MRTPDAFSPLYQEALCICMRHLEAGKSYVAWFDHCQRDCGDNQILIALCGGIILDSMEKAKAGGHDE